MESTNRFQPLTWRVAMAALAALTVSACGVDKQSAPDLAGPSGFAMSLSISAAPQILPRDGSSMSTISVTARNADGSPSVGRRLLFEASAGTLLTTEVLTNDNGTASVVYVAPSHNDPVSVAKIDVTPIEAGNLADTHRSSVQLELQGPDIPTPSFAFSPESPAQFQTVTFDASTTFLGGQACGSACQYDWTFSDGTTRTGMLTSYAFPNQGAQLVTLLVTAPSGTFRSVSRVVTVGPPVAPTAAFTFSPTNPEIGDQVFFNGGQSRGANGATIVSWDWSFGNNTFGTGVTPSAVIYTADRTFNVTLTVTDDRGQKASITQTVSVTMP